MVSYMDTGTIYEVVTDDAYAVPLHYITATEYVGNTFCEWWVTSASFNDRKEAQMICDDLNAGIDERHFGLNFILLR